MGSQSDGRDLLSPTEEMRQLYWEIDKLKQEHTEFLNGLKNNYETSRASLIAQIQQLDKVTDDAVKYTQYSFKQKKEFVMREVRVLEAREKNKKGAMVFERLPAEVLGIIFDEFVNGGDGVGAGGSPWALAFVCRFWYTTVLSTPRLWRTLLVTDRSLGFWNSKRQILGANNGKGAGLIPQPSGHRRLLPSLWSATQVCGTPAQLRTVLQRSGVSPLDVTLAFAQLNRFDLSDLPLPSIQMLYMLFTPPVCTRISHLELDSSRGQYLSTLQLPAAYAQSYNSVPSSPDALPTPLTIGFPGSVGYPATGFNTLVRPFPAHDVAMLNSTDIFKGPLSRIRSLSLHDYNVLANWPIIQLVTKACDSADHPGLDAVRLYISGLPTQLVEEQKLWSKIKYLQLNTTTDLNRLLVGDVEVEELALGSHYSPTVKWKSRDDVPEAWPNRGTLNVNFLRLTALSIVIDDFSILSRLTFPVLHSLEITAGIRYHTQSTNAAFCMTGTNNADIAAQYAHPDFVVPLPSLKSLKVRSPHCAPLVHFQMPVLEKFHLTTECKPKIRCEADLEPLFFPNELKEQKKADGAKDGVQESDAARLTSNGVAANTNSHFKTLCEFNFSADLTDKAVVRIIKALPALRSLSLRLTKRVGLKVFEELAIGKITGRIPNSITAPGLRVFQVDCTGEVEDTKKKAKKSTDPNGRIYPPTLDPPPALEPAPESAPGADGVSHETEDADGAKTLAKAMSKLATSRKRFWTALETCEVTWPDGKVETF